ncbi:MAG: T9SS type A sorting domain-containing protein [Bacteroidota bacterium]|nr:T9SS type A sorting domain-containing protein [Bacteroidota bacterium]
MKKQLLALAFILTLGGSLFSQNYYFLKSKGLVGTTNGTNYDYKKAVRGSGTTSVLALPADQSFSAVQTLPFAWSFFGTAVTQYIVSDNGFLTFNTSETVNPGTPTTLPNATAAAPKNAIFAFWYNFKLASGGGIVDQVFSFTYGTAPNRIHVVQWLSCTTPSGGLASFAIRFYEGKSFDIVHNQASAVISGTVGVNNADGTAGIAVAGAPATAFDATPTDDAYSTMGVWTFKPAPQPANDIELNKLDLQKYVSKNTSMPVKGTITNWGSQVLSSFKLHYSVDNGATVTMQLSGLNVAASGGVYNFTHNVPYVGTAAANSTIKVWTSLPNAGVDGDTTNNEMSGSFTIVNATVPRKVLHEMFTSSTCPPCKAGNEVLNSVLGVKLGGWNCIKYQVNFPGTGDPYYTLENGARFSFYTANFAPWLVVDGGSLWNAGSGGANAQLYTEGYFDNAAAIASLASITANYTRTGNTVTVSGAVTPVQAFTNTGLKLRISIIERQTINNAKTNGEISFDNVNKKMLPNAGGIAVSFAAGTPVTYSQTYTFPGAYRLPPDGQASSIIDLATEHSVEEFGYLSAIVFLQDDQDRTIWQSVATGPVWALGASELSDLGLSIYPNPAAGSFNLTFTETDVNGTVSIVDLNGREVLNQKINSSNSSINCDQLKDGLYFVNLNVNGKTAVKKLNIIR